MLKPGSPFRWSQPGGEDSRGTEDGQTLRLRGKGGPGYGGGPSGDALITVLVKPHAVFRREGDDILLTLPITIDEAVLGGKVTTPTIDGPVRLTVPPGQVRALSCGFGDANRAGRQKDQG